MDEQETMTRVEAAAYLVTKGVRCKPTTLAKWAGDSSGPPFTRGEGRVRPTIYTRADLDAWVAAGGHRRSTNPGGRPRKKNDLLEALDEFMPMLDKLAIEEGTFKDGMRYAHAVDRLRRALRHRQNGTS